MPAPANGLPVVTPRAALMLLAEELAAAEDVAPAEELAAADEVLPAEELAPVEDWAADEVLLPAEVLAEEVATLLTLEEGLPAAEDAPALPVLLVLPADEALPLLLPPPFPPPPPPHALRRPAHSNMLQVRLLRDTFFTWVSLKGIA
ncbi:hypothetical protein C0V76_04350 [Uliginosibacterium sp. TH139]|nr:hypothetical protein C0V76_04350 [Uliginosibacterium sp. TH139]